MFHFDLDFINLDSKIKTILLNNKTKKSLI